MENKEINQYLVENDIPFIYLYDTKLYLVDANNLPKNLELGSEIDAYKFNKTKPSLEEAMEVLCNALREDTTEGSLYHSWMCNIKMSMYDAMRDNGNIKDFNQEIILNMCEEGAKNFLNLLIRQ